VILNCGSSLNRAMRSTYWDSAEMEQSVTNIFRGMPAWRNDALTNADTAAETGRRLCRPSCRRSRTIVGVERTERWTQQHTDQGLPLKSTRLVSSAASSFALLPPMPSSGPEPE
jgi:hypothetical protein